MKGADHDDGGHFLLGGRRPSASADAARRAEIERVRRMTSYERLDLALALGRRSRAVAAKHADSRKKGS